MLEEIGYEYKVTTVDINNGEQFLKDFKRISPFSKIPVIIDHKNNKTIFESGAILIYLAEKSGKFYNEESRTEINQFLSKFTNKNFQFSFTPHLSPMFRGILSTIYLDLEKNVNQSKIIKTLKKSYKSENFVKILDSDKLLSTNDVINTNNCFITVCKTKYKNKIIIISAIDNLIKGGAGQAVQNLNNKFNFPEKTAL